MEDPILLGMLAVRRGPSTTARIRSQVAEAQAQAALEEDRLNARTLLGPRGGLPTLRADLLRLAPDHGGSGPLHEAVCHLLGPGLRGPV